MPLRDCECGCDAVVPAGVVVVVADAAEVTAVVFVVIARRPEDATGRDTLTPMGSRSSRAY